ncbi:MAG: alkaline phosphatase family protein, partial [Anaerolineae bacterium]
RASKLAVVGFDSISLPFLETFVQRGVMPTVRDLMARGSTTQTWPFYPMETATNWACLATGASPAVHGCNMAMPEPGGPLDRTVSAFPSTYCQAEQLWTAAHRAGKRSIVFDWAQSWPLAFEEGIVHVGEDGRPNFAIRALQESQAYTTDPAIPDSFHVRHVQPMPAHCWAYPSQGSAFEFELPIVPTHSNPFWRFSLPTQFKQVDALWARIEREGAGYGAVAVYASKEAERPILVCRPGAWSEWALHTFTADGAPVPAHVRSKLLKLSPDGSEVHLYLSEIYPAEGFVHPARLGPALIEACGPYVIQCSRQQVVIANASDIATYFDEQMYMGRWYRAAAEHLLNSEPWDLFMFKWHGPDWTNHLAMYMIDPQHAMYDPDRAEEGWAYWDRLMGLGDEIVRTVIESAGEDALVALVSDHGGNTNYGGPGLPDVNALLEAQGLLVRGPEGVDWTHTRAYCLKQYVYLNTVGRTAADGASVVEPGSEEYHALRAQLIETLLDLKDATSLAATFALPPG